ncbi:hypothetical protein EHS25_001984 [Saitozyma podzolica]|uniref:Uncharacterized protein n=1 Tax=Saitozyma podzolica TaxID=1890683 RepID=A0A427YE57_9TREE|nr:hypothetical protein EHS25_001984 [Saitozyma podzolica]
MSDDQTSQATWLLLDVGATEVDIGSGGELDSSFPALQKSFTMESVDGDDDLVNISYKNDETATSSPATSRTSGTSRNSTLRLRPFILTDTVSTPNGLVWNYRPVVNIESSDVVGTPQQLAAQVNCRLSQLISGDVSTTGPTRVAFRNALASQGGTFHVQHARTWTDLLKEATSRSSWDGRTGIPALRPGEITVDPTQFLTNNRVPTDVSPSPPVECVVHSGHPLPLWCFGTHAASR